MMSRADVNTSDTRADRDARSSAGIRERVEALGEWFQNLNLRGVQTAPTHPLGDYPTLKWRRFADAIPADLRGWTVLDIGCNAGFYSQEMKRRGADRVLGIDSDERYLAQAKFAAEVAGVDVEFRHMSVYQLPLLRERFDLVIFMGVLYHLRHPLLALDLIYSYVSKDLFVFQSMLRGSAEVKSFPKNSPFSEVAAFDDPAYPRMHFVEHLYAGDATNWWIPNRAAAEAMLRSAGFTITSHPEEEVYICRRVDQPYWDPRHREEPPWLKP
jgi:tRNA (mo5U34)-methyltransferase